MADRDGQELLEAWQAENRAHSFEGDSGLDKLTKLVEVLGYTGHGFKYGTPIEQFLSDNPGACDKIVEFIGEWADRNSEWGEALADAVEPQEDEEDEE